MLSVVKSMSLHGLDGYLISVQVDVSSGMPAWEVVGLPDASVKEARERVRTAIKNSDFEFQSRKIVVNLAPADIRKEGTFLDLPIAVGILINFEIINQVDLESTVIVGELSLDGKVNKINGVLPMCIEAKKLGMKRMILPKENSREASIVEGIEVIGVSNLKQVVNFLNKTEIIQPEIQDMNLLFQKHQQYRLDFSDVKGQENIKRALEVAAARRTQLLASRKSRITEKR